MKHTLNKITVLICIALMLSLPFTSALSISDIKAEDISDTFAVVRWQTDNISTSEVSYGQQKNALDTASDSNKVRNHSIFLSALQPNTQYYFSVASNNSERAVENNGGNFYTFTTLANDNVTPYINTIIPSIVDSSLIDIAGTAEPRSRVELYINGNLKRIKNTGDSNEFAFNQVELNDFTANKVVLNATDQSGNNNALSFNVSVDLQAPEITLGNIPSFTDKHNINITGNVSEVSLVEIFLNNASVLSENTASFSISVELKDGANFIEVKATDPAGRQITKTAEVALDTQPPEIKNLRPADGAFFYEGNEIIDIEGETEPNATLELIDRNGKTQYTEKADSLGRFKFSNVNLEVFTEVPRTGRIDTGAYIPEEYETVEEESEIITAKGADRAAVLKIKATDVLGYTAEDTFSYTIGTCFSGQMDWNVINMIEYQAPTMLSPERLEEGTEIITFILNLTYQGYGTDQKIKSIKLDPACKATEMKSSPEYNYSCKILPKSYIGRGNDQKTMWYIRYNLKKLEGLNNFSKDLWKDLSRSFTFPLKLKIEYSYKNDEGKTESSWQTQCINLAYTVDTSRIDPRKILPDSLLDSAISFLEDTSQKLEKARIQVEKVLKYTAVACVVGLGLKVITIISRRFQCWWDYIGDRALGDNDETKCEKKPRLSSRAGAKGTQDEYTEEELGNKCSSCKNAWDLEAKAYNAYRWACDRFLCRGSPAPWTSGADAEKVRVELEYGLVCKEKQGTQGVVLRKNQECKQAWGQECWEYEGSLYIWETEGRNDNGKDDQGNFILTKKGETKGAIPIFGKGPDELTVVGESGQVMVLKSEAKSCEEFCKGLKVNWDKGDCMNRPQIKTKFLDPKIKPQWHYYGQMTTCIEPTPNCICSNTNKKEGVESSTTLPEQETIPSAGEDWNYRAFKTGQKEYDEYIYYPARDKSACFGQNNWLFPSDPYLDPAEMWPTFQCLCVSGIRNRLMQLENIFKGLSGCLNQIKTTGKADSGVCKEVFTNYVCKWMYHLIAALMKGCTPFSGPGKDAEGGIGLNIQAATNSVFGGVDEAAGDLMSDYDNAALRDYLGVGEGAVVEKVCLGALTGDWGIDYDTLVDAAYSVPFHTSVMAWPAAREYLTWNPDNMQSVYEYRTAWVISPGCKIDSYSVSLACVTNNERNAKNGVACGINENGGPNYNSETGCDCFNLDAEKTKILYSNARGIAQAQFEDKNARKSIEDLYRYDHVKIKLFIHDADLRKKCLPEGHEDGVFYFPIKDMTAYDVAACRYDVTQGQFTCDQGALLWDMRGRAYFGEVKCDASQSCDEKVYYKDENLMLDKLEIYNQLKPHCLYWEIRRGGENGEKISSGYTDPFLPNNPPDEKNFVKYDAGKSGTTPIDLLGAPINNIHFQTTSRPQLPSGLRGDLEGDFTKELTAVLYFKDLDGEDRRAEQYATESGNFADLSPDMLIPLNSEDTVRLRFREAIVEQNPQGSYKCVIGGNTIENCQKYTIRITPSSAPLPQEPQKWTIHLELRHTPGDNEGDCAASTHEDLVSFGNVPQERNIDITVSPKTLSESGYCKVGGTADLVNNRPCDCNKDGDKEDDRDCNGEDKKYCYDVNTPCKTVPKCRSGDFRNRDPCDCNGNGVLDDYDNKKENECKGQFCHANPPYCDGNQEKPKDNPPEINGIEISIDGTKYNLDSSITKNQKLILRPTPPKETYQIELKGIIKEDKSIKSTRFILGTAEPQIDTIKDPSVGGWRFDTTRKEVQKNLRTKVNITVIDSAGNSDEFIFYFTITPPT